MNQLTVEQLRLWAKVAAKVVEIVEAAIKAWSSIKEKIIAMLPSIRTKHFERQAAIQHMRSSWFTHPDTRRTHQVLNNKPRFVVRKVIEGREINNE